MFVVVMLLIAVMSWLSKDGPSPTDLADSKLAAAVETAYYREHGRYTGSFADLVALEPSLEREVPIIVTADGQKFRIQAGSEDARSELEAVGYRGGEPVFLCASREKECRDDATW